jgi:hypothetical protein
MKMKFLNWLESKRIKYELTQLQSGHEGIFINAGDRYKVLEYCFKHKLLENYEFRENFEKVLLIFKIKE